MTMLNQRQQLEINTALEIIRSINDFDYNYGFAILFGWEDNKPMFCIMEEGEVLFEDFASMTDLVNKLRNIAKEL